MATLLYRSPLDGKLVEIVFSAVGDNSPPPLPSGRWDFCWVSGKRWYATRRDGVGENCQLHLMTSESHGEVAIIPVYADLRVVEDVEK